MELVEESSTMRASRLRPPSQIHSPGKGLSEISDSQGNARLKASMLPPPSNIPSKHKLQQYNEPEPKRKTLVERAAEPSGRSNVTAPTSSRPAVKGSSLASVFKSAIGRNPSSTSSSHSRTTSVSSRNTSNGSHGSFASSVGQYNRPTTSYSNRPGAFGQTTMSRTSSNLPRTRPGTAMDHNLEEDDVSGDKRKAWDVGGRLDAMESMYSKFEETIKSTTFDRTGLEEAITAYKARVFDLESQKAQLDSSKQALQHDLETMRQKSDMLQQRLLTANANLDDKMRAHHEEIDQMKRETRKEVDQLRRDNLEEIEKLLRLHREDLRSFERRAATDLEEKVKELERRYDAKLEDEKTRRAREVQELESKITSESLNGGLEMKKKEQELESLRGEIEDIKGDLDREQTLKSNAQSEIMQMKELLKKTGTESSTTIQSLEATVASLRARIHFLESGSKAQSDSFAEMESRLQDAVRSAEVSKKKLVKEETLRRILFNQVQELKGNIRVMCRVRPVFNGNEKDTAKISFPDVDKESKELAIQGKEEKSSLGTVTRKNHSFTFDRVFGPESQNQEVFEEISQLVQSALDGYNVCIFCYGQTGSGKTHTMSSEDGMIPRATHQIYETATNLKEKGWEYTMEGNFVEVYNEEIRDLLGNSSEKKKHDIQHDNAKKQTTVTGLKSVALDSPNTVEMMLKQAANNRSVAATKSNERSSRSHSVFILKLVGRNTMTGETSEGTLNLVDLAGSERLKQSGAEGDQMKETQNINKSLSCLGDVIGALGQGKEGAHIPYRNSKLTYLLQYSLGGNSKTLMFVMASPLEAHLSETLTSLKFATKVHNTHIGTAKKSTKSS